MTLSVKGAAITVAAISVVMVVAVARHCRGRATIEPATNAVHEIVAPHLETNTNCGSPALDLLLLQLLERAVATLLTKIRAERERERMRVT